MTGNITAVSIDCTFQQFIKKKVLEKCLTMLVQGTTQMDPLIKNLTNAGTAFSDAHIATDTANKARKEEALVKKTIKSIFPA